MSASGADAPGSWRHPPQGAPRRDQGFQQRPPPPPPAPPRRASPPRPSLLLGGVPQCELELSKLQQAYKGLLEKEEEEEGNEKDKSSPSPGEWSRLVSRFRWLRETLVSCGAGLATPLGLAAAASGADAALRAQDWGEFLKSVSYLASDGVVVSAAAEEAKSSSCSTSSSSSPPLSSTSVSTSASTSASTSTSSSASTSSLYAPHEADALLLLYFSCVPPQPQSLDVATRLRALGMRWQWRGEGKEEEKEKEVEDKSDDESKQPPPPSPPHHHPLPPPIELAMAVHVAMTTGDGLTLARLFEKHPAASWRTRALMKPALERSLFGAVAPASSPPPPPPSPALPARGGYPAALAALAASYRSLPVSAARRLLGIGEEEEDGEGALLGELVAAARGRGDRWALSAELPLTAAELKFK